jgi:hypothetical protein
MRFAGLELPSTSTSSACAGTHLHLPQQQQQQRQRLVRMGLAGSMQLGDAVVVSGWRLRGLAAGSSSSSSTAASTSGLGAGGEGSSSGGGAQGGGGVGGLLSSTLGAAAAAAAMVVTGGWGNARAAAATPPAIGDQGDPGISGTTTTTTTTSPLLLQRPVLCSSGLRIATVPDESGAVLAFTVSRPGAWLTAAAPPGPGAAGEEASAPGSLQASPARPANSPAAAGGGVGAAAGGGAGGGAAVRQLPFASPRSVRTAGTATEAGAGPDPVQGSVRPLVMELSASLPVADGMCLTPGLVIAHVGGHSTFGLVTQATWRF